MRHDANLGVLQRGIRFDAIDQCSAARRRRKQPFERNDFGPPRCNRFERFQRFMIAEGQNFAFAAGTLA